MHIRYIFFGLWFFNITILSADAITVHNMTDVQIFCAIYYKNKTATRVTGVVGIPVQSKQTMERPSLKIGTDRELIFSDKPADLTDQLSAERLKTIPAVNIGTLKGTNFYIAKKDEELKGYNQAEWKVIRTIVEKFQEAGTKGVKVIVEGKEVIVRELEKAGSIIVQAPASLQSQILSSQTIYQEYPYKSTQARIRVGNALPIEEVSATQRRLDVVKPAVEKKLQKHIAYTPRIALVGSGGGYRSMFYTLGFLAGAEQQGLLDCITWTTGLSGSTWAIGIWMTSQVKSNQSVTAFRDQFFSYIADKGLQDISPAEIKLMTDMWLVHALFSQPFTLVNFYGALLANRLLSFYGDKRQRVYLSDQRSAMQTGRLPIPIYTAVRGESGEHAWYEFTPWEVGGAWLGLYVPSWAYGRKFKDGVSTDFGIEKSFGFNLGTFGSAFSATVEQIYTELKNKIPLEVIRKVLEETVVKTIGEKRLTWAEAYNFTYKMDKSPIKQLKRIKVIDGGLAFNLAYPPVSGERIERKADILIFLDASETVKGGEGLKKAEAYARRKGLKFPVINYVGIDQQAISVFKNNQDPSVPVVIYIPVINDPNVSKRLHESAFARFKHLVSFDIARCLRQECSTYNFKYSRDQLQRLSDFGEMTAHVVTPLIVNEIAAFVQQRGG